MEEKKKENTQNAQMDPGRAAYMISWRDRHIEKQRELIEGYEEQRTLMEALLAVALWHTASEENGVRTVRIPKEVLSRVLGQYASEVESEEDAFLIRFFEKREPQDGEEREAE